VIFNWPAVIYVIQIDLFCLLTYNQWAETMADWCYGNWNWKNLDGLIVVEYEFNWLSKRTANGDPGLCCRLGVVVSFSALVTLRTGCIKPCRNCLRTVACERRSQGMAQPVDRVLKERQFVSGTVCSRIGYNEPDQSVHWYTLLSVITLVSFIVTKIKIYMLVWRLGLQFRMIVNP